MDRDNRVPMKMGEFSVMDTEFDNIRDRFDSEMKRMEEEMNRFRSELISRQADTFRKTSTSKSVYSSSESKTIVDGKEVEGSKSSYSSREVSGETDLLPGVTGAVGGHSAWLQGLQEDEASGSQELKLRFDVSEYAPEEIMVKTVDNKLLVHAKHEEVGGGKSVYREYNREFLLPTGTNPELIKSSLSKDGVLTVEAPLPTQAIENKEDK